MTKRVDFKQITPYHTPEESPGFLLWRVSTIWRRAVEEALKDFDLTHPQFVVLAATAWLTKTGDTASQAAIGRQAGLDANTTSQIVRGLEKKGFIERTRSADERSKYSTVTTLGARSLSKAMIAIEQVNKVFFAPLDLKKSGLIDNLQKLIKSS